MSRGVFAIVSVLLLVGSTRTSSQDAARRASDRLRALHAEAEQLLASEKTLLVELRRLEVERDIRLEEQRDSEAELRTVTEELATTTTHLASLEQTEASESPALAARLAEVYKLGRGGYLRMLLNVNDVRDMGRAYRTVTALAALDRQRVRAHQSTLASLGQVRKDLEAKRATAARLQRSARAASVEAQKAVDARAALVTRIDAQRDLNAQLAGELEAARARLTATVAGSTAAAPALPVRPFRGALDWPVRGAPTLAGVSRSARFGTSAARNGVEIAADAGGPVTAVHEGTVAYAAPFTGFGPLVIVDHGDRCYTLYGYLATTSVTKGARVDKGAAVGTVGRAPASGAPALYFEVRVDGKAVDPLQWLKPRLTRP